MKKGTTLQIESLFIIVSDEDTHRPIPDDEWETIVRHVPIVSVDLVVRVGDGVVLGKRSNEPAKGEWFVPGGTVFKAESREDAVHRVAREELGTDVTIDRQIGTYEHIYETAEMAGVESKHYLATGYIVRPEDEVVAEDDQHAEIRVFEPPFPDLHPYIEQYLGAVNWNE